MTINSFPNQESNRVSGHPQFTIEQGGLGSGQVNSVSRSNSEVTVDTIRNRRNLNYAMNRQQRPSNASMADASMQQQSQRRRTTDPFEMFLQLKRQQNKLQQQMGANGGGSVPMQSGNSMSSFHRMNSLGSFANMGSLSKMSNSDMSFVMSPQEPINGRNNQSWGNPNTNNMNGRSHASLPIMNASYHRMDTGNRNQSMSMGAMNAGRNTKFNSNSMSNFGNQRPNEFMNPIVPDDAGGSFPFHNNGGNQNNFQHNSAGFGNGGNEGGNNFGNNGNPTMNPNDFSKMSNEQLRQMILMDALGNSSVAGSRMVSLESGSNHGAKATNKNNSEHSSSTNPFLKNLGIMSFRNHLMPMTIERHSSRSSDLNTTGHSDVTMDFNQSNSNFSFHSDGMAHDEHGAMPDEKESYNAAANGILAPWSARAAGLFGDMMIQSTEDEKARKASRKKPKDKPKRPLSAYNIFFKEERNRILKKEKEDAEEDDVPTTISVNNVLDTSAKSDVSIEPTPSESKSSQSLPEDAKSDNDKSKKKIGFESLAKLIGRRWQELDAKSMAVYKSKASVDMERYKKEMEIYEAKTGTASSRKRKASNSANKKAKRGELSSSSAHETSSSSSPSKEGLPRRNSTGQSLDQAASSASSKNAGRLGTDLFRLTEVEEDNTNGSA